MSIIQRVPWTVQPQYPTTVNWSNPLTRGLVCAVNGATLTNSVNNTSGTLVGSGNRKPSAKGVSYDFDNSSYVSFPITWSATPYTLFAVGISTTDAGNQIYCGIANSGTSQNVAEIYRGVTFSTAFFIEITAGSSQQNPQVANTSLINKFYSIAGVTSSTTDRRCYVDGLEIGNATGSLALISAVDRFIVGVERYNGGLAGYFVGSIPLSCLWNRALSASEIASLSANPWQIFSPLSRRIWVPSAAAPGGFKAAWARNSNSVIQGMRA